MGDHYYRLSWSSVDGAGSDDEKIDDEQTAIERADAEQTNAEQGGNQWGYSYKVKRHYEGSTRTDTVYNARTGERTL